MGIYPNLVHKRSSYSNSSLKYKTCLLVCTRTNAFLLKKKILSIFILKCCKNNNKQNLNYHDNNNVNTIIATSTSVLGRAAQNYRE